MLIKIKTQIIITYEGFHAEDNEISIESSIPEEKNDASIDLYFERAKVGD